MALVDGRQGCNSDKLMSSLLIRVAFQEILNENPNRMIGLVNTILDEESVGGAVFILTPEHQLASSSLISHRIRACRSILSGCLMLIKAFSLNIIRLGASAGAARLRRWHSSGVSSSDLHCLALYEMTNLTNVLWESDSERLLQPEGVLGV